MTFDNGAWLGGEHRWTSIGDGEGRGGLLRQFRAGPDLHLGPGTRDVEQTTAAWLATNRSMQPRPAKGTGKGGFGRKSGLTQEVQEQALSLLIH